MATITRVHYEFLAGNLFSDEAGADVAASGERYADLVRNALGAEYPHAEIEVTVQPGQGVLSAVASYVETDEDGDWRTNEAEAEYDRVQAIVQLVWDQQDWIVEARP